MRRVDSRQSTVERRFDPAGSDPSLCPAGNEGAGRVLFRVDDERTRANESHRPAAAVERREANSIREPITYDRFKEIMESEGGFVYAGWNGDPAVEAKVKEETKATIRCIPVEEFRSREAPKKCMVTGEPAKVEALWARAY